MMRLNSVPFTMATEVMRQSYNPTHDDPRIAAMAKVVAKEQHLADIHNRMVEHQAAISKLEATRSEVEKELSEARQQVQDFIAASIQTP